MKTKTIGILGSTGSIGTNALDVVGENKDEFNIEFLTCGKNVNLLISQIKEFNPEMVSVENEVDAKELRKQFPKLDVYFGKDGLNEIVKNSNADLILNALVGMMGLEPTLKAIESGKDIALANKETLVSGGSLVMDGVKKNKVKLLPVDSEHSAIFQSLQGNEEEKIKRIILTASGGPFRGYSLSDLEKVSLKEALKHPNWSMGKKITIDSATMMNKGLEVIEAKWLFDIELEKIEVLVHRESIIHSMVEYQDKSIMAQLGMPDMRTPISYAFSYPKRLKSKQESVDFIALGKMHFEPVDLKVFKCLKMAYEVMRQEPSYPIVLNAANEVLVDRFLHGEISFLDIQNGVERALESHIPRNALELEEVLEIDKITREKVSKWVSQQ